ncbi:MAG: DNA topoisomerase IV subunit A [Desulfobulbus sp.]|jgi:topoisomerase-4 subunit A|uniref:DNA topoisomerase IV subunit A n=1 Tax=Desulfobulbus sp. TaxID=895 RepID=UPI00284B3019|nr:DNA topoisomerase IV subunit A [Desulfobulbus sp.]MDR2550519.1 DNA topoisomerase IV subunit A [Desulfobulbus sp.]
MSETTEAPRGKLHRLFDANFLDYTAYVIRERAIPDVDDGLKPVQRRILQTLHNMDDGRFHKVANVVGETMKLHPHGDQSIFDALVNLANKGYLIDRQGNFGNIFTGDQASAPRYIECRLSPLARETLFNRDLTEFIDSYDGRMQEPVRLPAKIPLLLLLGAEGIAVGMATKIMPHNFGELLSAQIKYLRGEQFTLYPDFPRGGIIDVTDYDHGNGRLRCRAKLEQPDPKTIIVTELPYNLTTQNLIESIEKAAKANKLKIASINDYTAEKVEVEIKLARGVLAEETIDALYAFTDCELSVSPSLVTIEDNLPRQHAVEEVLKRNTELLKANLEKELRIELGRLEEKWHARKLEQIFIEQRLYKEIEEKINYKAVVSTIRQSLVPFAEELQRKVTGEDVERLLEIKIRRISRYDINRQEKELREIEKQIAQIKQQLTDMVGFTIGCLDDLLARYGEQFPRKSELRAFDEVDARAAAAADLTVSYHRESGFFGHKIKSENATADLECCCSEYDRLLLIFKDGLYKVINVPDKLFVGPDLYWLGVVKNDLVFNLVYRHGPENLAYVKRFAMPKFIIGREYRLFEESKRSAILMLLLGREGLRIRASLAPSSRAKYNSIELDLDEVLIKGVGAKGKRVANRTVRKVADVTGTAKKPQPTPMDLPGIGSPADESDNPAKE